MTETEPQPNALETVNSSNAVTNCKLIRQNSPSIKQISSVVDETVHALLTNDIVRAKKFVDEHWSTNPKMALLSALLTYINAISSHDDSELTHSLNVVWATESIGSKLSYSPDPADALTGTLIQADTHLLGSMIQVIQESYVKALLNLRRSFSFYKQAQQQLKAVTLSSEEYELLEGWCLFGVGFFGILLSFLPPTLLTIASWTFFACAKSREESIEMLHKSQRSKSFMSPFSALLLLSYYLTISSFTGLESEHDLQDAKRLLDWSDQHYPNGALFRLMESRYYRSRKELRHAIEIVENAVNDVKDLPSV